MKKVFPANNFTQYFLPDLLSSEGVNIQWLWVQLLAPRSHVVKPFLQLLRHQWRAHLRTFSKWDWKLQGLQGITGAQRAAKHSQRALPLVSGVGLNLDKKSELSKLSDSVVILKYILLLTDVLKLKLNACYKIKGKWINMPCFLWVISNAIFVC